MDTADDVIAAVARVSNEEKAVFMKRFFKTGPGQYGEGDVFLGLTMPQSRAIAKQFQTLPLDEVIELLHNNIHENRLIALVILTIQYNQGSKTAKKQIFETYLANTRWINNWDLVDLSAEHIVGDYLREESEVPGVAKVSEEEIKVLTDLAGSQNMWERRIAIISCFGWIKKGEVGPTFVISDFLIHDKEDLIHKAVGWVLREVGKRVSEKEEENFLSTRYKTMPRTMLRYAIERFPEEKRKKYLAGTI